MILIGDENIAYENIVKITDVSDIENSQANSTLLFDYNIDLIKYCHNNSVKFSVVISNIKELIYSSQFDTKYIISSKELSVEAQKIAENYMFDSKILAIINSSEEIIWVAQNEIDGAIYKKVLL